MGKISEQLLKEGNEVFLMADSKIGEYTTKDYFPKGIRVISKVDWCKDNYKFNENQSAEISWKEYFSDYDRFRLFGKNFGEAVKDISQMGQFIDFVLRTEKPNAVIFEPPSGTFSEIAFNLCQKYKIPYLGFIFSRIEKRIDVYDLKHTCSGYEKDFLNNEEISEKERESALSFIRKFISHEELPSYMKYQNVHNNEISRLKSYSKKSMETLPHWKKYISERAEFKLFDSISENQLRHRSNYPMQILRLRMKRLFEGDVYSPAKDNDQFFLFPLHVQPEASTSVLATYFYDQLNTVKNIAFSLPLPYKLYVKEHPAVRGDRPENFYKELKKIPNVVLINPKEKVDGLIQKSKGVVTLTSTIGLEAALSGKPVYVLGNVFYSYHPLCRKIGGFEELKERIKEDLSKKENLEENNIRFVNSYCKNTVAGDLGVQNDKTDKNDYESICRDLKKIFLK